MAALTDPRWATRATVARRIAAGFACAGVAIAAACGGDLPTPPEVTTPPVEPPPPPPPPPPALRLTVLDVIPRADTITQLGLEFVARIDGSVVRAATVYVDSGTADERVARVKEQMTGYDSDLLFGALFVATAGRHRFTVVATDTGGRTVTGSFERTFVIDDEPYAAMALPSPGDGGAGGISPRGEVTGWVSTGGGPRRPAIWRGTALTIVPASDSFDVAARAINAAGDVLLQYDGARPAAARVRRADGAEFVIGPVRSQSNPTFYLCCDVAAELAEDRRALGTSTFPSSPPYASILDVARGQPDASEGLGVLVRNDRGQMAGVELSYGVVYISWLLRTFGFTAATLPSGHKVSICDRPQRFTRVVPLALDDAANVIADYCGNLVVLPGAGGSGVFLDRFVGRTTAVRLARRGGLVAAFDPAGSVLLWRVGTERTTRLRLGDPGWRLTELAGVTGDGVIAASAVHAATGRRAALRLVPAR
jgi:hypothetical protein